MIKRLFFLLLFLIANSFLLAQQKQFDELKLKFESFDYSKSIDLADTLLLNNALSDSLKIETNLIKAIANYALGNELKTKESFYNILVIKRTYLPDPNVISPRLIQIFDGVKTEYFQNNPLPEEIAKADSIAASKQTIITDTERYNGAIIKNMLLPGLGQISLENYNSGISQSGLALLNLGFLIKFISDSNQKEKLYLNETNINLISSRYSEYNTAFKARNLLITTYLAVWLYSQIDLLFFTTPPTKVESNSTTTFISFDPLLKSYHFNLKYNF